MKIILVPEPTDQWDLVAATAVALAGYVGAPPSFTFDPEGIVIPVDGDAPPLAVERLPAAPAAPVAADPTPPPTARTALRCQHCGRACGSAAGLKAHERNCRSRPDPASRSTPRPRPAPRPTSGNPIDASTALVDCPDGCGWRGKAEAVPLHRQSHTATPLDRGRVDHDAARAGAAAAL